MKQEKRIVVRGGGDLATGTIHRLWSAGLRVLVLEAEHPAAIRRQVSLCEAVYEGETTVEGLRAVRVASLAEADAVWAQNAVPVLVDPKGSCLAAAKPAVLVDAIIAKKNLGTTRDMAPLTIALGPGFVAGQDVDVVVETKRGHKLGRIIRCAGRHRRLWGRAGHPFARCRCVPESPRHRRFCGGWRDHRPARNAGRGDRPRHDADLRHPAGPSAGWLPGAEGLQGGRCRPSPRGAGKLLPHLRQGPLHRGQCAGAGGC